MPQPIVPIPTSYPNFYIVHTYVLTMPVLSFTPHPSTVFL